MVRLSFSMLINFPKLCYLDKWDHHGKIRKIWLPFQLCYSSGFPSSWVPISPVIAGVGMRASPSRTCFCLSPLHLIFYMCSPPFFLHPLAISNWFFMRPLCSISFVQKCQCCSASLLCGRSPWGQEAGSGFMSSLSLSVPKLPQGSLSPLFLGCSVGFWGVHLELWAGGGNDCSL